MAGFQCFCLSHRMLVGAPWDGPPNNRKGDVYKCMVGEQLNSNCSKVNLGEKMTNQTIHICIMRNMMRICMYMNIIRLCTADNAFQNVSRNLKNSHLGMTLTPDESSGFLVRLMRSGANLLMTFTTSLKKELARTRVYMAYEQAVEKKTLNVALFLFIEACPFTPMYMYAYVFRVLFQ